MLASYASTVPNHQKSTCAPHAISQTYNPGSGLIAWRCLKLLESESRARSNKVLFLAICTHTPPFHSLEPLTNRSRHVRRTNLQLN